MGMPFGADHGAELFLIHAASQSPSVAFHYESRKSNVITRYCLRRGRGSFSDTGIPPALGEKRPSVLWTRAARILGTGTLRSAAEAAY